MAEVPVQQLPLSLSEVLEPLHGFFHRGGCRAKKARDRFFENARTFIEKFYLSNRVSYDKICELVEKYSSKKNPTESDLLDLQEYRKYKKEYEDAVSSLGTDGIAAFNIWQEINDQRNASMTGPGALKISELNAYLKRLKLPDEEEDKLFEYVRYIDRIFLEKKRKEQDK